jgi:hypothetical protein
MTLVFEKRYFEEQRHGIKKIPSLNRFTVHTVPLRVRRG